MLKSLATLGFLAMPRQLVKHKLKKQNKGDKNMIKKIFKKIANYMLIVFLVGATYKINGNTLS